MLVVEAREKHLERIVELWDQLARAHEERDPAFLRSGSAEAFFRTRVMECMESEDAAVMVCEDAERVIGYLTAVVRSGPPVLERGAFGLVDQLLVDLPERRKGAGTLLAREALGWFAAKGVDRVEVEVAEWNEPGMMFWRKLGFGPFQRTLFRDLP